MAQSNLKGHGSKWKFFLGQIVCYLECTNQILLRHIPLWNTYWIPLSFSALTLAISQATACLVHAAVYFDNIFSKKCALLLDQVPVQLSWFVWYLSDNEHLKPQTFQLSGATEDTESSNLPWRNLLCQSFLTFLLANNLTWVYRQRTNTLQFMELLPKDSRRVLWPFIMQM